MGQTDDFLQYYADQLPIQYRTLPNAVATVQVLAALALMPQGGNVVTDPATGDPLFEDGELVTDGPFGQIMPLALLDAFDIDTAEGQQLQFLGKLVGASNQGFNLSDQFIQLSDNDYRQLIKAVGGRNFLRATNGNVDAFINQYFSGILTYTDQGNMAMSFVYLKPVGQILWAELFITEGFLPRPLAVQANISYTYPVTGPFFSLMGELDANPAPNSVGLDTELGNIIGFFLTESQSITFPY